MHPPAPPPVNASLLCIGGNFVSLMEILTYQARELPHALTGKIAQTYLTLIYVYKITII